MRDPVGGGADMAGMISTEYLERCLQKCSLNNVVMVEEGGGEVEGDFSSSSSPGDGDGNGNDIIDDQSSSVNGEEETTLDLNSHISLPLHWERCLDLKSGEIYYINWRTGKKVWEEDANSSNLYYSPSPYDSCSEESNSTSTGGVVSSLSPSSSSTSNSSCFSSRERQCYEADQGGDQYRKIKKKKKMIKKKKTSSSNKKMEMDHEEDQEEDEQQEQQVLVVAGCRNCFMYYMVPRLVQDCPKCFSQLLHFDEPSSSFLN